MRRLLATSDAARACAEGDTLALLLVPAASAQEARRVGYELIASTCPERLEEVVVTLADEAHAAYMAAWLVLRVEALEGGGHLLELDESLEPRLATAILRGYAEAALGDARVALRRLRVDA